MRGWSVSRVFQVADVPFAPLLGTALWDLTRDLSRSDYRDPDREE
jgi:hypothetical protein